MKPKYLLVDKTGFDELIVDEMAVDDSEIVVDELGPHHMKALMTEFLFILCISEFE